MDLHPNPSSDMIVIHCLRDYFISIKHSLWKLGPTNSNTKGSHLLFRGSTTGPPHIFICSNCTTVHSLTLHNKFFNTPCLSETQIQITAWSTCVITLPHDVNYFNPKWHHTLGRITPVLSLNGPFAGASFISSMCASLAPHLLNGPFAGASFISLMCASLAPHLLNGPFSRSVIILP